MQNFFFTERRLEEWLIGIKQDKIDFFYVNLKQNGLLSDLKKQMSQI